MTRIVRFEELNGDLILRVPADVAERLGFVAGEEAVMTDQDRALSVERIDDELQLKAGRAVAARHRDALARLAR